jgi:hypothetical protein
MALKRMCREARASDEVERVKGVPTSSRSPPGTHTPHRPTPACRARSRPVGHEVGSALEDAVWPKRLAGRAGDGLSDAILEALLTRSPRAAARGLHSLRQLTLPGDRLAVGRHQRESNAAIGAPLRDRSIPARPLRIQDDLLVQVAESLRLLFGVSRRDLSVRDLESAKGLEVLGDVFGPSQAGEPDQPVRELIDPAVHLEREILERHTPKVSAEPPECQSRVRGSAIVAAGKAARGVGTVSSASS